MTDHEKWLRVDAKRELVLHLLDVAGQAERPEPWRALFAEMLRWLDREAARLGNPGAGP
jgi:hypothetical protein